MKIRKCPVSPTLRHEPGRVSGRLQYADVGQTLAVCQHCGTAITRRHKHSPWWLSERSGTLAKSSRRQVDRASAHRRPSPGTKPTASSDFGRLPNSEVEQLRHQHRNADDVAQKAFGHLRQAPTTLTK